MSGERFPRWPPQRPHRPHHTHHSTPQRRHATSTVHSQPRNARAARRHPHKHTQAHAHTGARSHKRRPVTKPANPRLLQLEAASRHGQYAVRWTRQDWVSYCIKFGRVAAARFRRHHRLPHCVAIRISSLFSINLVHIHLYSSPASPFSSPPPPPPHSASYLIRSYTSAARTRPPIWPLVHHPRPHPA